MSRILIVEDNELNMKLFRDLLLLHKHEVLISKDGLDVISVAQNESLDLILMDIQLSGVCGLDLIKNLKSNPQTALIPIVVVTAFAMKNDEIRITDSGCDLYITKPVSIDQFFHALERFVS